MSEILKLGTALFTLIGFGLAMGLNPALYVATADVLARNVQPAARLRWMIAGLAVGATVLLAIFHSVNPTYIVNTSKGVLNKLLVNQIIDLCAAILFIIAALFVLWWKRRTPTMVVKPKKEPRPNAKPFSYFYLGLTACVGFTTLPIMYLTGRLIADLTSDYLLRTIAYGVFIVALAAPFFAMSWVWTRIPKLTGKITQFYSAAVHWDYRFVLAGLLFACGVLFVWLAFFAPAVR